MSGIESVGFGDGAVNLGGMPAGMGLVATGTADVTLGASMTLGEVEISGSAKVTSGIGREQRAGGDGGEYQ